MQQVCLGGSGDSEERNAQLGASLCHSRGTQERGISGARSGMLQHQAKTLTVADDPWNWNSGRALVMGEGEGSEIESRERWGVGYGGRTGRMRPARGRVCSCCSCCSCC